MLEFDDATTQVLEDAYRGADVMARRRANFDALAPCAGDTVLDLGCGNGLMTVELSRAVGASGRVVGVDASAPMLKAAAENCAGRDNVELCEATALALPLNDDSVDRAVSVQVFEYFQDVPATLDELARVLRRGARLVIGDIHFDSVAWHSDDPARMARMLVAWDQHLADRSLPARLPGILSDAGFDYDRTIAVPVCDTRGAPDGLAALLIRIIPVYVIAEGLIDEAEARAWTREQEELAKAGRFFFSLTHFVTVAHKL